MISLFIAEKLVQQGMPFRKAHKITGQLVQTAFQSKKSLSQLSPKEIKQSGNTDVDVKLVSKILKSVSVTSSLQDMNSEGSTGFGEQKRMIASRIKKINAYRNGMAKRDSKLANSLEALSKKVRILKK